MRTLITQSWNFRTYKIQAKCKCIECSKPITKSFSFELREDVSPKKEDWDNLEKEKKEWLAESHICNSCKCKRIRQEREFITENFKKQFNELAQIHKEEVEFEKSINEKRNLIFEELKEKLKGKILLALDREWVIRSIGYGWNGESFQINCEGVDKQKPWEYCNKSLYAVDKETNHEQGNSYWTNIENCIITDEDFYRRKELL